MIIVYHHHSTLDCFCYFCTNHSIKQHLFFHLICFGYHNYFSIPDVGFFQLQFFSTPFFLARLGKYLALLGPCQSWKIDCTKNHNKSRTYKKNKEFPHNENNLINQGIVFTMYRSLIPKMGFWNLN